MDTGIIENDNEPHGFVEAGDVTLNKTAEFDMGEDDEDLPDVLDLKEEDAI